MYMFVLLSLGFCLTTSF